ncbi:MAG TPA: Hsp20/alpha crystallin family protein [Candidatus Baltobacteraceae bacterium]|nr:Hsp20/alpha crystallin family protein [Candidatus Baltobacteraceae bacterium]
MTLLKTRDSDLALIDQVLDSFFDWQTPTRIAYPNAPLDLYEKEGTYVLEMSVPGYDPKDISVEINGNAVTVSGKHTAKTEKNDVRYHRREMRSGAFSRTVAVPQDLDANHVIATIDKGMLKVELTPVKPLTPTKIEVKSA